MSVNGTWRVRVHRDFVKSRLQWFGDNRSEAFPSEEDLARQCQCETCFDAV